MQIRLRWPTGLATLTDIEESTLIADFLERVSEKTSIPLLLLEILVGFPPMPIDTTFSAATVGQLGIQNGDNLTVRQRIEHRSTASTAPSQVTSLPSSTQSADHSGIMDETPAHMSEEEQLARAIAASLEDVPSTYTSHPQHPPSYDGVRDQPATLSSTLPQKRYQSINKGAPAFEPLSDGTAVVRREVADDNSCLFSAVGYVAMGGRSAASSLRQIVAQVVLSDPVEWNEAVLGKDPIEYAHWIRDNRHWGGAIELSILSKHLEVEIAAFDIQTQRIDIYGQHKKYPSRVMVIYDGLHYDALAVSAGVGAGENMDTMSFPSSGTKTDVIMAGASRLVAHAHAARQFTDTTNFTLRCGVCKRGLKGEKEAVKHAQLTGHQNFTEY